VSSALSELRRVGRTFHTPSEAAPGCIWLMLQLAGTAPVVPPTLPTWLRIPPGTRTWAEHQAASG
jgi:hypothetical protein